MTRYSCQIEAITRTRREHDMLGILSDSFRTATRLNDTNVREGRGHWAPNTRFDNRRDAELEAHRIGRLPR